MKKILSLALVLILVLLAGCSDKPAVPSSTANPGPETTTAAPQPVTTTAEPVPVTTTAAPATTAVPTTEAPATAAPTTEAPATQAPTAPTGEPVDPWSLMDESLFMQGAYTDSSENTYTYSYGLPCLAAETPDALAINAEIDEFFGGIVREQEEAMRENASLGCDHVGYHGEVWNNVLTLVVIAHWDWSFEDYGIYCYDTAAGRRLDTPALLEKMGVSQEAFLEACKTRFRETFEDMYKTIPEDQQEAYGYHDALARVDSPEFVNLELKAYPDANGDIVVIAPIVSLAGADYYFHAINLGINQAN